MNPAKGLPKINTRGKHSSAGFEVRIWWRSTGRTWWRHHTPPSFSPDSSHEAWTRAWSSFRVAEE